MHVKVLEYIVYTADGRSWRSEKVLRPSWPQIEEAIRRLDRYRYPFLFLWASEDEDRHVLDGNNDVFNIIGGKGAYWLSATSVEGGYFERRTVNANAGTDEVQVWTSDQGFATPERNICRDIEAALRAARYYAETGGLIPLMEWEDGQG